MTGESQLTATEQECIRLATLTLGYAVKNQWGKALRFFEQAVNADDHSAFIMVTVWADAQNHVAPFDDQPIVFVDVATGVRATAGSAVADTTIPASVHWATEIIKARASSDYDTFDKVWHRCPSEDFPACVLAVLNVASATIAQTLNVCPDGHMHP